MGGRVRGKYLASVDILDTSNDTVLEGPSMKVPRSYCASAVIGHRIFVVGGCGERLVEYLEFASLCDKDETKEKERDSSTILSALSSSGWTTRSDWMLFAPRFTCTMVAMGSCLVLAGLGSRTVDVLDTCRNRWWTLPPLGHCRNGWNHRNGCRMVAVAKQKVAVIGGTGIRGHRNDSCATLPLILDDRHSWCFGQLCEQHPNEWWWYHQCLAAATLTLSSSPSTTRRVSDP